MRLFNISFFIVQWLGLCGVQLVLLLALQNLQILFIYSVFGLEVFRISKGTKCLLVFPLFIGLYDLVEMMLRSTNQNQNLFWR
jgi:hypothetical protein